MNEPTQAGGLDAQPTSSPDPADEDSPGLWTRIKRLFGLAPPPTPRAQIRALLRRDFNQKLEKRSFTRQERLMLLNILRIEDLRVDDIMVPRADIIAIDEQSSLHDLLHLFENVAHSRVPLYRDTLDDPRGMIHIKDLMLWMTSTAGRSQRDDDGGGEEEMNGRAALRLVDPDGATVGTYDLSKIDPNLILSATKLRRDMLYVPPSMPVLDLFLRMQSTRTHLALVVDEYGGTDGLVSIEDLVEAVVGEIEDEHDTEEGSLITQHPRLGLIAEARTPIEELEMRLGFDLKPDEGDDDIDTLGGLVFTLARRVPVPGEIVAHSCGVEFEVLDADPRRIKRLRIHIPREGGGKKPAAAAPEAESPQVADAGG